MVDIKAAVEYVTGKAPSSEWIERIGKIRFLLGWQNGDPFADAIAILDAEGRLLSGELKQISLETAGILKKVYEASETEIVSCKEKMALVTAEMKEKMVNDVVPQVSERVASAASEQISRMSMKIGFERGMLLLFGATVILVFAIAFGFLLGNGNYLLNFLKHVNTSVYAIDTVIGVAVSRVVVAMFVICVILGCFCLSAYMTTMWMRGKQEIWIWATMSAITISCVFIWWSFFVNSPNIHIVREKSAAPALFSAIKDNAKPELVKDIMATGVSVNVEDDDGMTPIMLAAKYNPNPEIVKMLVGLGAKINARDQNGNTPLLLAVGDNPNSDVVTTLIDLGADINAKQNDGISAILATVTNDSAGLDAIIALIRAGVDVNEGHGENKLTPLMAAARATKTPEIISVLMKNGARVNEKSENGKTALIYAAHYTSNPDVVKVLINAKADITAKDRNGNTALDFALQNEALKNSDVIQLLKPTSRK